MPHADTTWRLSIFKNTVQSRQLEQRVLHLMSLICLPYLGPCNSPMVMYHSMRYMRDPGSMIDPSVREILLDVCVWL